MRFFETIREISFTSRSSGWVYFFLFFSIYSLVAQWDWPSVIRPFLLTVGLLISIIVATYLLWAETRKDRFLLAFIVGVIVFWIAAFPAAINGNDDNAAYLIFAKDFYFDIAKTIQPLSERRLFSVGGTYAFQAPVIHWFGINGLGFVEPVLGLILYFILATSKNFKNPSIYCYFLVGVMALLPLAGSKILANTASVFILSALTFALLELGFSILEKQSVTWTEIILLVILPLSASVFRPTTAPFNIIISGLMVIFILIKMKEIKKIIFASTFSLVIFYFALQPYYHVGSTYLYPILGRGSHITAEGYSIAASIGLHQHFVNFFKAVFSDPIFVINISLAVTLFNLVPKSLKGKAVLTVIGVYLLFYFLLVFGTGGLSSTRYVFPVSLAIFMMLLSKLLCHPKILAFFNMGRFSRAACISWVAGIMSCLVLARITVGSFVVENRLKTYQPEPAALASIKKIQKIANQVAESKSATLLIGTGYERYIVNNLEGPYFIMDQPGMLSPWLNLKLAYGVGFNVFLIENNIKTIIMYKPDCNPSEFGAYSGWSELMKFAQFRNDQAICDLISKSRIISVEPFTILILNSR